MTNYSRHYHRGLSATVALTLVVVANGCGGTSGPQSDLGEPTVIPPEASATTTILAISTSTLTVSTSTDLARVTSTVDTAEQETTDYQNVGAQEEVYLFESFAELVGGADIVVLASVAGLVDGPPEGSAEDPFPTADVKLAVTEVLRGEAPATDGQISLRLPVGRAEGDFARLQDSLPVGNAIWVLRYLTPADKSTFATLTTGSVIETAPDGSAQPAWYRATAAEARTGRLSAEAAYRSGQNGALALELAELKFDDAVAIARATGG